MRRSPGENRERVMDVIRASIEEDGVPPTIREICEATGISSTSVVNYHINSLVDEGRLEKQPEVSRGIRLADTERSHVAENRLLDLMEEFGTNSLTIYRGNVRDNEPKWLLAIETGKAMVGGTGDTLETAIERARANRDRAERMAARAKVPA